jgi:hypothetical protein
MAATIPDNRIKTILYKLVRRTVRIGCRIDGQIHACQYSPLWICDERTQVISASFGDIPCGKLRRRRSATFVLNAHEVKPAHSFFIKLRRTELSVTF